MRAVGENPENGDTKKSLRNLRDWRWVDRKTGESTHHKADEPYEGPDTPWLLHPDGPDGLGPLCTDKPADDENDSDESDESEDESNDDSEKEPEKGSDKPSDKPVRDSKRESEKKPDDILTSSGKDAEKTSTAWEPSDKSAVKEK